MEEHFRTPEFPKSQGRPWPDFCGIPPWHLPDSHGFHDWNPTWTWKTRLPDWALGNCKRRVFFNIFDVTCFLHGDFGLSSEIDVFLYQFLYEVDQLSIIMVLNYVFIICVYPLFFKSYFSSWFISYVVFIIKFPKLLTPRKINMEPENTPPFQRKIIWTKPSFSGSISNLPGRKLFPTLCHFINGCQLGSFIKKANWMIICHQFHLVREPENNRVISDISSDRACDC